MVGAETLSGVTLVLPAPPTWKGPSRKLTAPKVGFDWNGAPIAPPPMSRPLTSSQAMPSPLQQQQRADREPGEHERHAGRGDLPGAVGEAEAREQGLAGDRLRVGVLLHAAHAGEDAQQRVEPAGGAGAGRPGRARPSVARAGIAGAPVADAAAVARRLRVIAVLVGTAGTAGAGAQREPARRDVGRGRARDRLAAAEGAEIVGARRIGQREAVVAAGVRIV